MISKLLRSLAQLSPISQTFPLFFQLNNCSLMPFLFHISCFPLEPTALALALATTTDQVITRTLPLPLLHPSPLLHSPPPPPPPQPLHLTSVSVKSHFLFPLHRYLGVIKAPYLIISPKVSQWCLITSFQSGGSSGNIIINNRCT